MATWYIVDGNLPYLEEFPPMPSIDDAPNSLWKIIDGDLPFKSAFPQMPSIDDAPDYMWKIIDGELPFKTLFPEMYDVETRSNVYLDGQKMKTFFIGDDKVLKIYLGDKLVMG